MTWFRVDDSFPSHPKVRSVPRAIRMRVLGTWLACGTWSAKHLTDGRVTGDVVLDEGGKTADAAALVEAGLWHTVAHACERCPQPAAGEYQFHDWPTYQKTKDQVLAERRETAERVSKFRERKRRNAGGNAVTELDETAVNAAGNAVTNADTAPLVTPPPARPGPKVKDNTPPPPPASAPPAGRGTRLPDDFEPSPALLAWVRAKCPGLPASEHERFCDHWRSTPGVKGRKADWDAAWRNWMRRAHDDRAGRPGGRSAAARPNGAEARLDKARTIADQLKAREGLATVTDLPAIGGSA